MELDTIVSLAKRRGFVYPTGSIYGGLANSYDYGPLGAQLLKNIKDLWWKRFIEQRADMVGLQTQILQHPQTWVASGHTTSFSDPLVEDTVTHKRYRADHLVESWLSKHQDVVIKNIADLSVAELGTLIETHKILSPDGNPVTPPKSFNLLFETEIGAVAGEKAKLYLRGETAQGIFTNFKHVLDTTRVRLPFGIGNFGTSFRNEITTGQFVFRTLEFEQAEIEYFFNPTTNDWQKLFEAWKAAMWQFVTKDLGLSEANLRWRRHGDSERSHYSLDTYDLEYNYPFGGFKEMWGVAYRTDFDLKQHMKFSGEDLQYTDPFTKQSIIPHVIEPALGIARAFLAVLLDSYREKEGRVWLQFPAMLAPVQVAVFPLHKNKPELVAKAKEVFESLLPHFRTTFDERGNIGKRYLSQDEVGTPFCITIDFDSLEDEAVTVRHRDTAVQERVRIDTLIAWLRENFVQSVS